MLKTSQNLKWEDRALDLKKEVREYPFDYAKNNFNYNLYPYGKTVFERNQIWAPLGTY